MGHLTLVTPGDHGCPQRRVERRKATPVEPRWDLNGTYAGDVYDDERAFRVRCRVDAIGVVIEVERPDGQCESIVSFDSGVSHLVRGVLDFFSSQATVPFPGP